MRGNWQIYLARSTAVREQTAGTAALGLRCAQSSVLAQAIVRQAGHSRLDGSHFAGKALRMAISKQCPAVVIKP